jgi:hypothetical protein
MSAPPFLRPFWRYYGGKWRAAPRYPQPIYDTIIEPFAGAAGYSLRHYRRNVILVEKYARVAEIWRYLIGVSSAEILRIPEVEHVDDLPPWVPVGGRDLVGFAMNAAVVAPCKQLSSGRKQLRAAGRVFEGWSKALRARVAEQVNHIRHWRVIEGSYETAPDTEATWFIDPPYQVAGSYYIHGSAEIDFVALGEWCQARRGQAIACENAGATWLPFVPFQTIKASPMSNKGGASQG